MFAFAVATIRHSKHLRTEREPKKVVDEQRRFER
jgi:hypothetical protein